MTTDTTPDHPSANFPTEPPPLPAEAVRAQSASPITGNTGRIVAAAMLGALACDAVLWGAGRPATGYGLALALIALAALPALVRTDLVRRERMFYTALMTGCAGASAWHADPLTPWLALTILVALLRRPVSPESTARATPEAPVSWRVALLDRVIRPTATGLRLRGRAGPVFVGVAATVVFLALLSIGNAALAHHLGQAGAWMRDHFRFVDSDWVTRPLLWCAGAILVGVVTLARPSGKPAAPLAKPQAGGDTRAVAALLCGMNVAFLLSNTVDAVWLWWRRSAPTGVSTTDYLYDGGWALLTVTGIAGAVLLVAFRNTGAARGSGTARRLGYALLGQCLFIGAGVALRLGLQADKYGFTPTRTAGFLFIAYGAIGVWWLSRHLREETGVRAFVRRMGITAFAFLYVIQFYDTRSASTDLNLVCWRAHPGWKFTPGDYARLGPEGVRLWIDRRSGGASDPTIDEPYGLDERVTTEPFATPAAPADWRDGTWHLAHLRELARGASTETPAHGYTR